MGKTRKYVNWSDNDNCWKLTYGDGEGDGIFLYNLRDLEELYKCIGDYLNGEHLDLFFREKDGAMIVVESSEASPGKIVIKRADGNWGRYTPYEISALRNELSSMILAVREALAHIAARRSSYDDQFRDRLGRDPLLGDPLLMREPLVDPRLLPKARVIRYYEPDQTDCCGH